MAKERIHIKSKQLTMDDRESLYHCLKRGLNLTDSAKYLHCSISTIKREIDRNKELKINGIYKNKCGLKNKCQKKTICGNTKCIKFCKKCNKSEINCNLICNEFTLVPRCKRLKHICGVCNGCENYTECNLNKYIYNPLEAQKKHEINLSNGHKGVKLSEEEIKEFSSFLKGYVDRNISLQVIKESNPEKFPYSIQSVYSWIDNKILTNIDNIMLPRKVRYSPRNSEKKKTTIDRSYLENRYYEDFLNYITEHPYDEVLEMDTVEGCQKQSYILTILFRKSNFMLAFKLKDHTSTSVIEVFDNIKTQIGMDNFKKFFKIILTDRGNEFSKPLDIEIDYSTGEKVCNVFYCDARQSQQKGKIEKNHEELRKIFPKGFDFNLITQEQLNLAMSHVNSYPRPMLNYKTPYELFKITASPLLLLLNNSIPITIKNLTLKPSLIKL